MSDGTGVADRAAHAREQAGRRAPALLLLLTVLALFAGICHGAHGHKLPAAHGHALPAAHGHVLPAAHGAASVPAAERAPGPGARAADPDVRAPGPGARAAAPSASPVPGSPTHGCHEGGDGGLPHDVHLPAAQTPAAPQLTAPDTAGAPLVAHDALFPADPHARRVRDRAGPGPEPGHLLIALGVNRN
ncbi:hypothetical protein [Streptomyces gulbargensis]|uniref:hypothetical protein n=1 Tax=Streptomyces gulbargensis TaxID=364901 RepID=UPI0031E85474